MNMKRILCLLMSLLLILSCFSCGKKETKTEEVSAPSAAEEAQTEVTAAGTPQEETAVTAPVTEYTPYGAVEMSIPLEDFNASGFDLGDSCEVRFSNGYTLEDVPYYNGYNARSGDPVICAYPGYLPGDGALEIRRAEGGRQRDGHAEGKRQIPGDSGHFEYRLQQREK